VLLSLACLVVIIIVAFATKGFPRQETASPKNSESATAKIRSVLDEHLRDKPPETWELTNNQDQAISIASRKSPEISEVLAKYRDLSPLTEEINTLAPFWSAIVLPNGMTVAAERGRLGSSMVAFSTPGYFHSRRVPAACFYDRKLNALVISGIQWPSNALEGIVMHEAGHMLRAKQGAASSRSPDHSDLYIKEELDMHLLEAEIFDSLSEGDYLRTVAEISARWPEDVNWTEALLQVRPEDLHDLDQTIECNDCPILVAGLLAVQHIFTVGSHQIDRMNLSPEEAERERIALYRFIRKIAIG